MAGFLAGAKEGERKMSMIFVILIEMKSGQKAGQPVYDKIEPRYLWRTFGVSGGTLQINPQDINKQLLLPDL